LEQYLHVLLVIVIVLLELKDDGSTATTVQQTTVVISHALCMSLLGWPGNALYELIEILKEGIAFGS
jgi:hypothetical protein